MLATATRSDFTFREPSALGALLVYNWRMRGVLTDAEVLEEAIDQPVSTGVLRHLQRLGQIRAVHGVRSQGGRMRLWPLADVLKAQAVLDLRAATGARLAACVDAFALCPDLLTAAVEDWERHIGSAQDRRSEVALAHKPAVLMADCDALHQFALASVEAFVQRNKLGEDERPTFLL
jgi:hypothetical protein